MKKLFALLLVLPVAAFAVMDVNPSDTTVNPGVWCGNFTAAKNYADQHGIPLVLVWGVRTTKYGECEHCAALTAELKTSAGLAWAASKNAVFCFVEGFDWNDVGANAGSGAKAFAQTANGTMGALSTTPFVCLYWSLRRPTRFTGTLGTMYSTEGSSLLAQFENSFEKFVSEVPPSYASFPFGDTVNDRLEVVVGKTQYIDIPVTRTDMTNVAATCKVSFSCDGVVSDTNIVWAAGETMKFARFNLPGTLTSSSSISVSLGDASAVVLETRTIHPVLEANLENSPKNPYWLGEKAPAALNWGEWTIDIDAATNKVNAWNAANPSQRAYAMILVEGCCWCPDCAMTEANIFGNPEFKAWAESRRIVFGVIDIPSNPQPIDAKPSLLRYETYRTGDSFVTLRGTAATNETMRYQSGAGYLSRHSIDYADALALADRNRFLMGHDTLNGGWNRPERTNKNRTGVPVFLLLRGDGTIAARWNRFSDVGPGEYHSGYLRRFDEMLAMVDDEHEESDDDKSTTTRTVALTDSLSGTLSAVDQADVYAIGATADMAVKYDISGGDGELAASIIDTNGVVLATASGVASAGFSVFARLDERKCFLKIAPKAVADGTFFGYTNGTSTLCSYAVSATGWPSGGEIGFVDSAISVTAGGCATIGVARSNGKAGAASVKVTLSYNGAEGRVAFQDQVLSWADGESGVKNVQLDVQSDAEAQGTADVMLELVELNAASADVTLVDGATSVRVSVLDDDVFGTLLDKNVAYGESVSIDGWQAGDAISLCKVEGSLPAGLSVSCASGAVTIGGFPSRAGEYSVSYEVRLLRGGTAVASQLIELEYTVRDFNFATIVPSLSGTRTYRSLPVIGEDMRVKGVLDLTVPRTGRLSARYRMSGASYSYSAKCWAGYDAPYGTVTALLSAVAPENGQMTVVLDSGGGTATFDDPSGGGVLSVAFSSDVWSAANPATTYQGQYTVQMPQTNIADTASAMRLSGSAYMAMRMVSGSAVNSGTMLFAGVLPNGRTFSGTSMLAPSGTGSAYMPFYCSRADSVAPYAVSGEFEIFPRDAGLWTVKEHAIASWQTSEAFDHSADFEVYGGYYDADGVQAAFDGDFSGATENFGILLDTASVASSRHGNGVAAAAVPLSMVSGVPQIRPLAGNPQDVTLRFSQWTGVVSGEFYVPFEGEGRLAVTYRGIALPGWQGCDACAEGFVERPWAVGAFSFSDRSSAGAYRNGAGIEIGRMW